MCSQVPYSVFSYLKTVYTNRIVQEIAVLDGEYDQQRKNAIEQKEKHLHMFRPNLENPSNKQATADLNEAESRRSDDLKDLIDDTQLGLLDIEQNNSLKYYTAYLNNVRALILLFNNVIYKENFIMLPGDEVTEKKHKNVRHLIAMERNEDLSRREMRAFAGCGQCNFKIDFSKLSPEAYALPDNN